MTPYVNKYKHNRILIYDNWGTGNTGMNVTEGSIFYIVVYIPTPVYIRLLYIMVSLFWTDVFFTQSIVFSETLIFSSNPIWSHLGTFHYRHLAYLMPLCSYCFGKCYVDPPLITRYFLPRSHDSLQSRTRTGEAMLSTVLFRDLLRCDVLIYGEQITCRLPSSGA